MTYQEFKNKYNGQYVDYDGACGYQCWDLGQFYLTECLGVPEYVLSGCGLVSNMLYSPKREQLNEFFDEVPVTQMKEGDVVIWEYGHIAIYDHYDGNQNWYFSQNPNPCQVMTIGRDGLHAFRRKQAPKPVPEFEIVPIPKKKIAFACDTGLIDLSYDNLSNLKILQMFPKGQVNDVVAIYKHKLGYNYYLTDYCFNKGVYNGYNVADCEDYIEPEPIVDGRDEKIQELEKEVQYLTDELVSYDKIFECHRNGTYKLKIYDGENLYIKKG